MRSSGDTAGVGRGPRHFHIPGAAAYPAEAPAVRAPVSVGELSLAAGTSAPILTHEPDASLPLEHIEHLYDSSIGRLRLGGQCCPEV